MKTNKGFATMLGIIVVLLIAGGGAYLYVDKNKFVAESDESVVIVDEVLTEEVSTEIEEPETPSDNGKSTSEQTIKEPTFEEKFGKSKSNTPISEYTPADNGQSLFAAIFASKTVEARINFDETSSYLGFCDSLLERLRGEYATMLDRYEKSGAIDTPYTPFDELIKDFSCIDSEEHYEVDFSILYSSGYYREFHITDMNPIFRL